jgi:hypothetical protein
MVRAETGAGEGVPDQAFRLALGLGGLGSRHGVTEARIATIPAGREILAEPVSR